MLTSADKACKQFGPRLGPAFFFFFVVLAIFVFKWGLYLAGHTLFNGLVVFLNAFFLNLKN